MNITQKEYCLLKEEIAELKILVSKLTNRVGELEEENYKLKEENRRLTKENIELKDRLGLNSTNSSLPSSRDLYKIKKAMKEPSGKNPGGQKGHIGITRNRMVPDEIVTINPEEQYCICGGAIALAKMPQIIQKIEMPPIKPHVTEYRLYKGRCSCCRKRYHSHLPEGVTPDLLGPRLKTIITSLTAMFKGSKREVQEVLQNMFGVKIALGTVSNTEHRVSHCCKGAYDTLVTEIRESQQTHADETGHKNKGVRHWAWLLTHTKTTVLFLRRSRAMKEIKQILPEFKGLLISDRYGAYNCFGQKNRQLCWAHLLRDFERIAHSAHLSVSVCGRYLRHTAQEVFALHKALKKKTITLLLFHRRMCKLRKRLLHNMKKLLQIDDVPRVHNTAKLMIKAEPMMWTFLRDPLGIPLTNNAAERQIRPFVVYRKKFFFTWSDRGDRFLERLISLHLTWKQNGLNPFEQLSKLLAA
jgi:transposase